MLAIAVVALLGFVAILRFSGPSVAALFHKRIESFLADRLRSRVEISDFRFSFLPQPTVTVSGLALYHHGRTDVPPLIRIANLSMSPYLKSLLGRTLRFSRVELRGLEITFPPRENRALSPKRLGLDLASKFPIFVEELDAADATITLLRAQTDKPPLVFPVHSLQVKDLSFDRASQFDARLTNAVPRGEIHAQGSFGPWNGEDPRTTSVNADYEFLHADLGTIKGLQGTLSSTGTFGGPIDYLDVKGSTVTPDFTLRRVDNPLELRTTFSATVDGTNGNTYLRSVEAHFLSTTLYTSGEIVDLVSAVSSRTIILNAESDSARAEDLIRLAVNAKTPVLKGPVRLRARIHIPESNEDLSDRLDVTSKFLLTAGAFGDPLLQQRVDVLSRKGQGEPNNTSILHVPSHLEASIHSSRGVVAFPHIHYSVPGARLNIHGTYTLGAGDLDFQGELLLDASLSQTTTGIRSFLLKPLILFSVRRMGEQGCR